MQIWTRRVRTRLLTTTMRRLSTRLLPWVLIGLGLWILRDAIGLIWPGTALRLVHPSAYCTGALPFGPITTRPDGLVTGNAFGQYLGCDAIVQF